MIDGSRNRAVLASWYFDRRDEFVAPSGQSLDEDGIIRGIAKRLAQSFDGCIQTGFEINKSVFIPELGM